MHARAARPTHGAPTPTWVGAAAHGSNAGVGLRRAGSGGARGATSPLATSGAVKGAWSAQLASRRLVGTAAIAVEDTPGTAEDGNDGTPKKAEVEAAYGAGQIQVLEGLEPVRKRPGMYIGNTGHKGLHHMVWEVLDNAIDEVQAGYAKHAEVMVGKDGSVTVMDDGRGIPTDVHPTTGKSALETVLTVLHAGGKFGGDSSGYQVSGGLHGVGISVVNALSSSVEVTVWRGGEEHTQAFSRGVPQGSISSRPAPAGAPKRGTKVGTTSS